MMEMESGFEEYIGRKCVIRTFSAGVHMGTVVYIDLGNPKVCRIKDCTRIWSWEGQLNLSGVAEEGIDSGRLQRCSEVGLTEVIEYLPITESALSTLGAVAGSTAAAGSTAVAMAAAMAVMMAAATATAGATTAAMAAAVEVAMSSDGSGRGGGLA